MKKWRCTVCGYIHEGDTPPDICPICSVGPELFEEVKATVKKWRCTVCGFVTEGDEPPEVCPACGVGPELFELLEDNSDPLDPKIKQVVQTYLFNCSYGLYAVSAVEGDKINAMISNTFMQVTDTPIRTVVCMNKGGKTAQMIKNTKKFAVSILGQNNHDIVKHFGSQSGHVTDKFEGIDHFLGEETGCPGLPEALVFVEVEVESVTELGTHLMFVGKVVGGKDLTDGKPMTYAYYRKTR